MAFGLRLILFTITWTTALAALGAPAFAGYYGVPDISEYAWSLPYAHFLPYALPAVYSLFSILSSLLAMGIVVRRGVPLAGSRCALKKAAGTASWAGSNLPLPTSQEGNRNAGEGAGGSKEEAQLVSEEEGEATRQLRKIDELRSAEAKLAVKMHRRIIPKTEELPVRPELAFGSAYIPAENTGGDLFDAARAGKNGYTLLVADVSGRGVASALAASLVKNAFRSRAAWDIDVASVATAVNDELTSILGGSERYVTAFFAMLDLENGRLSYINAGHPPAMLLRRRSSVASDLDAEGPPMGMREGDIFARGECRLEEGDRILLFTDGLSAARNYRGDSFGRERIARTFSQAAREPIGAIPLAIQAELETFTAGAPHVDDIVILTAEFRSFARSPDARKRRMATGEDYRSLSSRGAALVQAGRLDEAIAAYERLLVIEPEDAVALNNLGALYWRIGKRIRAAELFQSASKSDPTDPRIVRNLALVNRRGIIDHPAKRIEEGALGASVSPLSIGGEEELEELESAEEAETVEELESAEEPEAVEELESVEEAGTVEELEPAEEPEAVEELEELETVEEVEETV